MSEQEQKPAKPIHPKTRRFKLDSERLETLDDVKKILELLDIRIDSNNPAYDNVWEFFSTEVVPRGYMPLRKKIGDEGIAKLHYHEIEEAANKLLRGEDIE
jgi:hypothetical protein